MSEQPFSNREILLMFEAIKATQELHSAQNTSMLAKQDYTNGRIRRLYFYLTVIGSVTATLLFVNGSELLGFFKLII